MSTTNERTKQVQAKYWALEITSILLTIGPMLGYLIYGYIVSETQQKVVLSMTTMCAVVFGALNIVFKKQLRSVVWILFLGIAYAVDQLTSLVIVMAVCTIIDEFAVAPAAKIFKQKLITNKEIDKRGT